MAAGATVYETGRACKNGHVRYRYTKSGTCSGCVDGKDHAMAFEFLPKWANSREKIIAIGGMTPEIVKMFSRLDENGNVYAGPGAGPRWDQGLPGEATMTVNGREYSYTSIEKVLLGKADMIVPWEYEKLALHPLR